MVRHDHISNSSSEVRRPLVIILEPDALTRWSVHTYLTRWFDVASTGDSQEADLILDEHTADAVVISDAVPALSVARIEAHARNRNPGVRLVHTVSDSPGQEGRPDQLEKPFELRGLARLLGVELGDGSAAAKRVRTQARS